MTKTTGIHSRINTSLWDTAVALDQMDPAQVVASAVQLNEGGLVRSRGADVQLEAAFRDVSAAELETALTAAGIAVDGSATGLTVTDIVVGDGTSRAFIGGFMAASDLLRLDQILIDAGMEQSLISVLPVAYETRVGAVTSQGDQAQRSDDARANFGVDGTGFTVGVISDSFGAEVGSDGTTPTSTTVADDVASGDLPANVLVLREGAPISADGDEGRAMAQIVHDVAPGADIAFHTANGGQAVFAQGIRDLAAPVASGGAGAQIVVDDIIYFAEPIFQDGVIAQAAADVVLAGTSYFSSAGNDGDDAFFDVFRDSGVDADTISGINPLGLNNNLGALHDWNPDPLQESLFVELTLAPEEDFTISFQWDEAYASAGGLGATSDLDIYITEVTAGGETLVTSGIFNNIGSNPIELVSVENDGAADQTLRIYIAEFDPSDEVTANIMAGVFFGSFGGFLEEDTNPRIVSDTPNVPDLAAPQFGEKASFGHSNAEGALAVGASAYFFTEEFASPTTSSIPRLNQFSSRGGFDIFFDRAGNRLATPDERDSVDFVAPDGGNTTFFGGDADSDGFPNFFGTSAAAPHAAAVAALLLEIDPTLTPAEIEAALEQSAADSPISFDNAGRPVTVESTGAGLIDANIAAQIVTDALTPGNTAPDPVDDVFTADTTAPVSGNVLDDNGAGADTDPNGDALTVTAVNDQAQNVGELFTLASGSRLRLDDDGAFTYRPSLADRTGEPGTIFTESFTYTVSDAGALSNFATAQIDLTPISEELVAADTFVLVSATATDVVISPLENVLNFGSTAPTLVGVSGSVLPGRTFEADLNAGTVTYTPGSAFSDLGAGERRYDQLFYDVDDGTPTSSRGFIDIIVIGEGSTVAGTNGNDLIVGGATDDEITGGDGADTIAGGTGADVIFGSAGRDILAGEDGGDVIIGDDITSDDVAEILARLPDVDLSAYVAGGAAPASEATALTSREGGSSTLLFEPAAGPILLDGFDLV